MSTARGDLEPALFGDELVEAPAAHELHHDVGLLAVQAEVDDRDAVRVLEPRHQPGLALEPLAAFHRRRQRGVHDLDRDRAIELQPDAAIDDAHRALGEPLEDLVAAVENFTAEVTPGHEQGISGAM